MGKKMINTMLKAGVVLGGAVVLSACTSLGMLKEHSLTPSDFDQAVAIEYRDFSAHEKQQRHYINSEYFAQKGLNSLDDLHPQPELTKNWSLRQADITDLSAARARLVNALVSGGKINLPDVAAKAQVSYDCMVAYAEKRQDAPSCRDNFSQAIAALEASLKAPAADAGAAARRAGGNHYVVWFDFDGSRLNKKGAETLAEVVASLRELAGKNYSVTLSGHTDRAGSERYNQGLSERRAESVKKALTNNDIPGDKLTTHGYGETMPKVPTKDGVAEPANRRVEIEIQE